MKKNPYLEQAAKMLKKQKMYTKFRDENLLEISQDKESKVFCFLTIEKEQFPGMIISLAFDYHETYVVADMVINLMHIAPVALGEAFYRSKNGNLYWGTDAAFHFALECDSQIIRDIEPVSKDLH
jgi:hypothetical protein